MNIIASVDPATRFRIDEFAKQEQLSFSAAVRALVSRGWDARLADIANEAAPQSRGDARS
jgi:hypothetical protein